MEKFLIRDTTKKERIELIRAWIPADDGLEDCGIDLWEMYDPYIRGEKEIAECNAEFHEGFLTEEDLKALPGCAPGDRSR